MTAIAEKANSIGTMMAYNVSVVLEKGDRLAVCSVVISAKQNSDLDYMMVLDESEQVIATFDSVRAIATNYAEADFVERVSRDGLTYQTATPIISHQKVLGRVYFGLSLQSLKAEIAKSRSTIAWVSLGICLIGVFFAVALSALISTPLVKMVDAVEKLSRGDWKQRAKVNSKDEIGLLATAFNTMVDNLELAYDDLGRSEKSYRDLFESNPHPMWMHDLETLKFLEVNDSAVESYGYSREEFLMMTIHDVIVESPAERMEQLRTRQGNLYRSTGWRHLKKDGSIIEVEMSSHSLPLSSGRKARLVLANDITERKRAAEALQKSETQFRLIWEKSNDGMRVTDENGIIVMANDSFCRLVGKTRGEIEGRPFSTMYASDKQGQILQKYCERFKSRTVESRFERELTLWNGKKIWFEVSDSFFEFEGQRPCLFSVVRDTTERKRAEEAIVLQKTRFEQLFENAPIGIVLADNNERIIQANRVFQEMFEYTLNELRGRTIDETILPKHLSDEGNTLANRVLLGEPVQTETARMTKGGRLIAVGLYGVPIMMNGSAVGVFGMYVDITERKRAEKDILMLAHTVRGISESVSITDTEDRIIFVNNAFEQTYGYRQDEVIGKPISIVRAQRDKSIPILSATIEGGWHGEVMNRRKDGTEFPIQLSTSLIRDENGNTLALVGVATDITEAKRIAQKQVQLMEELESINKELNDFAYIVSHDLKAPLRAIGSLVSWLSTDYGDKLGEEGNEMLKILLSRTNRMHDLIDGVLRYSRIGRTKERNTQIELDKLVPEIVEMIDPPKHIDVKIHRPLPIIIGETTRVQQVFQNLVSNAVKFMDKDRGLIRIGCDRENGHWKFSVADNGPGIDERHFSKVFQIFQTLSPRDDFESTGIGLTIVKKIVEMYGGKVWLESKVGSGTTFYFTFPAPIDEMNKETQWK
jgi:PAS domain S-box-containing protein